MLGSMISGPGAASLGWAAVLVAWYLRHHVKEQAKLWRERPRA